MKKLIVLALILLPLLTACQKELNITIDNPLAVDRNNEMVEINLNQIRQQLSLKDDESFIVKDTKGTEIPYQITHDQKVIFQISIEASGSKYCSITKGLPQKVETKACGKLYPERMDDLAWENDLMGFRAYGPALQQKGERAFGYDLFAKRGTDKPVLEDMYAKECDEKAWEKFRELNKKDPQAAQEWRKQITYHSDRGHGMDCYAVGPTLGAGVAALMDGKNIVYPWCYKSCDILDNGPLRFTAKLVFTPMQFKDTQIIETRIITLDAGSHMNRTSVAFQGIDKSSPIVSGIVLHQNSDVFEKDTEKGYIIYQDPTTGPDQGLLFLGHVHAQPVKDTRMVYFSEEEAKLRNNAQGHLLAEGIYEPNSEFVYYWGFGWNRSDIKDFAAWKTYVEDFAAKVKSPLVVSVD